MVEDAIATLARQFQESPKQFFHERELHATFFGLCRHRLPIVATKDAHQIQVFRYEYESIWKYKRSAPAPYTEPLEDRGTTACLDFVVLREQFVRDHNLLMVINKDETLRSELRKKLWADDGSSRVIEVGIEFKMAHRSKNFDIKIGQINSLHNGMLLDSRKLAVERVSNGYLLGFSHGSAPDKDTAAKIIQEVIREHSKVRSDQLNVRSDPLAVKLNVLLATPDKTYLSAGWRDPGAFRCPEREACVIEC